MTNWQLAMVLGCVLARSARADTPPTDPPVEPSPTDPPPPVDQPPLEPKPEPTKPELPKPIDPPKPTEPPNPKPPTIEPKAEPEGKSWLGFPPLGSLLYATSTAEFGVVFGSFPSAGGFGTGFHYTERGGLFAQMLMAGLAGGANATAAQRRANQTGRTQTYETSSPEDFGNVGMAINAMATQLGGNVSGIQAELFGIRKLKKHSDLPVLFDFGFSFFYYKGPTTQEMDAMGNVVTVKHDPFGAGLILGVLAPISRWAQLELHARPTVSELWLTFEAAGVINIGNRLYGRLAVNVAQTGDAAYMFGFGGRL